MEKSISKRVKWWVWAPTYEYLFNQYLKLSVTYLRYNLEGQYELGYSFLWLIRSIQNRRCSGTEHSLSTGSGGPRDWSPKVQHTPMFICIYSPISMGLSWQSGGTSKVACMECSYLCYGHPSWVESDLCRRGSNAQRGWNKTARRIPRPKHVIPQQT